MILLRNDYILRLNQFLDGIKKLKRLEEDKALTHIIHMEELIIDLPKSLKNQNGISEKNYDNLYLLGSKPGICHGLARIHKAHEDRIPTFCPILFAIGTNCQSSVIS